VDGIGYAHAMGLHMPIPPRQPRKLATIKLRWDEFWSPQCILAAKREDDPADAFCNFHIAYRRRMDKLLSANMDWRSIVRGDLDSPLQSGTEFDRMLCLAIERRRRTLGREKNKRSK
jgi:hypothetical protein